MQRINRRIDNVFFRSFFDKTIAGSHVNFIETQAVYIILLLQRDVTVRAEENKETFKMTDRVFTCSKWLSSVIDNFCNNVFKIVKRDTSVMLDKLTPKELKTKQTHIAKERWRRVRRQVASECCERPCTVRTIIMYCPDDAKLLVENPDLFH